MEEKEQWTMQNIRAIYEAGPSEEEMIKRRRRSKRIEIICIGVVILLMILWFISPWLETLRIMKKGFGINLMSLGCEYQYENTLGRMEWGGHILVTFTTTSEEADSILALHRDELSDTLYTNDYRDETNLSEEELKLWEEQTQYDRWMLERTLNIEEGTLKGKTKRFSIENRKYTPIKISCKCGHPEYIHVQENADETVRVYLYYSE